MIVLLAEGGQDASRFNPNLVRSYLAALRVPLYVWNAAGGKAKEAEAAWGGAEDVSSLSKMARAFERLEEDLATQRIAWVEGRHLPRAVEMRGGDPRVQMLEPAALGEKRP